MARDFPIGSIGLCDSLDMNGSTIEHLVIGAEDSGNHFNAANDAGATLITIARNGRAHFFGDHHDWIYEFPEAKFEVELETRKRGISSRHNGGDFLLGKSALWFTPEGNIFLTGNNFRLSINTFEVEATRIDLSNSMPINNWRIVSTEPNRETVFWNQE